MQITTKYKPEITSNIASYSYPDEADKAAVIELTDRIKGHISILRSLEISGIFISFKEVQKVDRKALDFLIEELTALSTRTTIHIGLGDYSHTFFPVLLKLIKRTSISLYKNLNIMAFASGTRASLSSILVYIEDPYDAGMIVSHLISKHYFVVISHSVEDFKKRISGNRKVYDQVITESHFGNTENKVLIKFKKSIFHYTFYGKLDKNLITNINQKDFKERLDFGFKIFIFDLSNVLYIDMNAANFIIGFLHIAQKYDASICLVGLERENFDSNAYNLMTQNNFSDFSEIEDIYHDVDVLEILSQQHSLAYSEGISKKIIEFIPNFIRATRYVLSLIDISDISVQTQQCTIEKEPKIDPYIATHISFYGDYHGEINFIFPKESVDVILERKYENVEDLNKDDHIDALKEFTQIIMDKLSTQLENKYLSIESGFAMATDGENIDLSCRDHRYVFETFFCDEHPFYVTITDYLPEK